MIHSGSNARILTEGEIIQEELSAEDDQTKETKINSKKMTD